MLDILYLGNRHEAGAERDGVKCSHVLNACIPDSDTVLGGIEPLQC